MFQHLNNPKPIAKSGLADRSKETRPDIPKYSREEGKALIERMEAYDSEMVTGRFKNNENPGQTLKFPIKLYPSWEYELYEFEHNEVYRIPRGVARHLNNNCGVNQYAYLNGAEGRVMAAAAIPYTSEYITGSSNNITLVKKIDRYSFEPLEFGADSMESFQQRFYVKDAPQLFPSAI